MNSGHFCFNEIPDLSELTRHKTKTESWPREGRERLGFRVFRLPLLEFPRKLAEGFYQVVGLGIVMVQGKLDFSGV